MSDVRAFVGHSFTQDDAAVITAFTSYFDTLRQSPINFSWVHAEPAEPTDLAAKVMRLMGECNLFIAICTKKQRVIQPEDLVSPWLPPDRLQGLRSKFLWKTSDWIIQEIGLALGKGLSLLLLLEKGVEKPGGLQGNIEYIEFERRAPYASFSKILQMISALAPKATPIGVDATTDPRSLPEERTEREPLASDEWWRPKPDWPQRRYDIVLGHLTAIGEEEKREAVSAAYLQSDLGQEEVNRERWAAVAEVHKIIYGKDGSLTKLRGLASAHPRNSGVHEQLAIGLAHFGEHREAASAYRQAVAQAASAKEQVRLWGRAARSYKRENLLNEADDAVERIRELVSQQQEVEEVALRALATLVENNDEESLPILERIIELQPDDNDTRFSLAFKHSENGHLTLALLHYESIPDHVRSGGAWNNLGVVRDNSDLSGLAVAAYRKAEDAGETLGMSNLAQKLLDAGFIKEATTQCEKALALPQRHKNVGRLWAQIQEVSEKESTKRDDLVGSARPSSSFYRLFGYAYARAMSADLRGEWIAPDCRLSVTVTGSEFVAAGTYERPSLVGLFGLGHALTPGATAPRDTWRVLINGTISGRTIKGVITRTRVGDVPKPSTTLGSNDDNTPIHIVVSEGNKELKVMESSDGSRLNFYSLVRPPINELGVTG